MGAAPGLCLWHWTTIYATSLVLLFPILSGLYVQGNAATQASVLVVGSLPSPLDPFGFTKFVLSDCWLLITGGLMLRSPYFARPLGYLTLVAGIGVLLLFIGNVTNTSFLILGTGVPGSAFIGPLFWVWVGYTLWTKH